MGKKVKTEYRTSHAGNRSDANVAWDKARTAKPPPPRETEKGDR